MVKIINIDTKTKTIHISNADGDIKTWRTTESGTHFPIREGESTKEALDKFVGSKRPEAKKENPNSWTMGDGTKIEVKGDWVIRTDKNGQKSRISKKEWESLDADGDAESGPLTREPNWQPVKGRTLETEPDQPSHPDDPRDNEAGTDDNFHALWEKYVPDKGTAETLFGEMLRAAGRIRYRYYNDGDMYGYGYGKETVNNAISYLSKLAGGRDTEFKKELDRALYQATTAAAHYDEDEYKRQVDRIADAFASASWDDIQALASVKNNTDSLTEYPDDTSYDDDDEDEEW